MIIKYWRHPPKEGYKLLFWLFPGKASVGLTVHAPSATWPLRLELGISRYPSKCTLGLSVRKVVETTITGKLKYSIHLRGMEITRMTTMVWLVGESFSLETMSRLGRSRRR